MFLREHYHLLKSVFDVKEWENVQKYFSVCHSFSLMIPNLVRMLAVLVQKKALRLSPDNLFFLPICLCFPELILKIITEFLKVSEGQR